MIIKELEAMTIYLKDVAIIVPKHHSSMCHGVDHQVWAFPLAPQLPMAKKFDPGVEQKNLVPQMELCLLDSLIMPSFGSLLIDSSIVISFLSPFFQFWDLKLSIEAGWGEVYIPSFYGPMCPMLELNWYVACLSLYKLVWWHTDGGLVCGPICPKCIMDLVHPSYPHFLNSLLHNVLDLLIWGFWLFACLGMIRCSHIVPYRHFR